MIQRLKNGKGAVARFGSGTVKIISYPLKTRPGGQIELTTCKKSPIGYNEGLETVEGSNKIVLNFPSVKSLDILIQKLEDLRETLVDGDNHD